MTTKQTPKALLATDKGTCVVKLDEQITRYARRIAAQVCGGFVDNNTVGGVVDALIIQEAVRRRLTDNDMNEDDVFSATVKDREKLRKRDLNAGVHGRRWPNDLYRIERDRRDPSQKDRRIKARVRVGIGITPDV